MAGQSLIFRTYALINGNTNKLILTNRFSQMNLNAPLPRMKSDSKALMDSYQIPDKPKRPLTAYFAFMLEKRPEVIKANPTLQNREIVKIMADEWKTLNAEARAKYDEKALQDREKYIDEIVRYNAKLTPEQDEILHQIQSDKRHEKQKRRIRKESREKGKPKRPTSVYGLFLKEHLQPGKSLSSPDLRDKWNALSETEKENYSLIYKRNFEAYEKSLAKWESDMIAEGKSYLVRVKTLKMELPEEKKTTKAKAKKSKPQ